MPSRTIDRVWRLWLLGMVVVAGFVFGLQFLHSPPESAPVDSAVEHAPPVREARRSELTLRDGRLYAAGDEQPFTGLLYDDFADQVRQVEIQIRDGKAHGRSIGYYENQQPEVEEFFVEGVSHGLRTRWYANGQKRSQEVIVQGALHGPCLEWWDSGEKKAEAMMEEGKPIAEARLWHPTGRLKSLLRFDGGTPAHVQHFPDTGPVPDRLTGK